MKWTGSLKASVKPGEKVVHFGTNTPYADPIKHKEASMWTRFWNWVNAARGWTAVWMFCLIFLPLVLGILGVALWLHVLFIRWAAQ